MPHSPFARAWKTLVAILLAAAMAATAVPASALTAPAHDVDFSATAPDAAPDAIPETHDARDSADGHGHDDVEAPSVETPAAEALAGDSTVTVNGTVSEMAHAPGNFMIAVTGAGFLPVALDGVDPTELAEFQNITIRVPAGFESKDSSPEAVFAALEELVFAERGTLLAVVDVRNRDVAKNGLNLDSVITAATHKVWAAVVSPHNGSPSAHPSQTLANVQEAIAHTNTFWRAQSANRVKVELTKFQPHYKSTGFGDGYYCDVNESPLLWNEAAKKLGFTYGANKHLALFFAEEFDTELCYGGGSIGLGHIGSKVSSGGAVWVVGTNSKTAKSTLSHELGHNFSFGHANIASCASGVPNLFNSTACDGYYAYWDYFDVMGYGMPNSDGGALSSPGAIRAGLWSTSDYHIASAGVKSYAIQSMSTNSGKRAIVVADPITKEKYYVELRTFTGSDAQVAGEIAAYGDTWLGAGVRILQTRSLNSSHQTFLLPNGPETISGTPKNTFYTQGQSFTTRSGGTTITVTAYNPATHTATVQVISRGSSPSTPLITGEARYNSTLAADVSDWISLYPGTTNLTYQWYRSGTAISGTAGKAATYTLTTSDIGKTMTVKVSATLGLWNTKVSKTSAKSPKVVALTINKNPVTISGVVRVGETLSADTAAWTLAPGGTHPLAVSYQWYRSGTSITGAKSSTYALVSADRGKTITVKITGKSTGYTTATQTSPKTVAVAYGVIQGTAGGTVTLNPTTMTLTAAPTGITESSVKYSYQWMRDGKKISTATKSTYKLATSDRQKMVSVVITVKKSAYTTQTFTSTPVNYTTTASSLVPVIVTPWAAKVGEPLGLEARTYDEGSTQSYQWLRDGATIKNATAPTYVPTKSDVGKQLSVRVTSTKAGTLPHISTSAKTQKVGTHAFTAALIATVERVEPTSTTLRAIPDQIVEPGVSYKYQWLRDGKSISKATKSTYKLTSSDRNKLISVRITVSKKSFTTQVVSSTRLSYTVASAAPTITGTLAVGNTLTGVVPTPDPVGSVASYQWLRDGTVIKGATASTYKLTSTDRAKAISFRVTFTHPGYVSRIVTSSKTAKIGYGTIAPQGTPVVSYTVGTTSTKYTVTPGTWQSGVKFTYQWYYNGKAVKDQTKSTYTRKSTTNFHLVSVKVTAKLTGYTSVGKTVSSAII